MIDKFIDIDGTELIAEIITNPLDKYYYLKNQYHRLGGPAREYSDGTYFWFKHGKIHRIGGPAYFNPRVNYYEWRINGKLVNPYYIYG